MPILVSIVSYTNVNQSPALWGIQEHTTAHFSVKGVEPLNQGMQSVLQCIEQNVGLNPIIGVGLDQGRCWYRLWRSLCLGHVFPYHNVTLTVSGILARGTPETIVPPQAVDRIQRQVQEAFHY